MRAEYGRGSALPLPRSQSLLESPEEYAQEDHGELRAGDLCPHCGKACLDYDGLLNLACPECGYALGGCFT